MKQTHHIGYVQTPSVKNLSNVKNALVENGLVPLTTPNEMLPDAIEKGLENLKPENVRGNVKIGNVTGTIATTIDEVDVNSYNAIPLTLEDFSFSYFAKNGIDAYGSYSSGTKKGLYHINLLTNEKTLIYEKGLNWKFFEEKKQGLVYCSADATSSDSYGLLLLKGSTAQIVENCTNTYGILTTYLMQDKLYFSVYPFGIGILNDNVATKIFSKSTRYTVFFESSKKRLYCGGGSNTSDPLVIIENDQPKQITLANFGNSINYFCESSNGDIYIGSEAMNKSGIYYLNNSDEPFHIYTSGWEWEHFYTDNNNNVFASSDASDSYTEQGLLHLKNGVATKIWNYGNRWKYWHKDSLGNLYVSTDNTTNSSGYSGILMIKPDLTIKKIHTKTDTTFDAFIELPQFCYFGSSKEGTGVIAYDKQNDTATKIALSSYGWTKFVKNNDTSIYVTGKNKQLYFIENTTYTQLFTKYFLTQFAKTDKGIIAATDNINSLEKPPLLLVNDKVYSLYKKVD